MNTEEPRENEVFEITIERKETGKMCEDTIRFSRNCRKYRKRFHDFGDKYEFPIGSTIRLNGRDLYVSDTDPTANCMKCVLARPEQLLDFGVFAGSRLCASSMCRSGQRADRKNIHYRLKEEVVEHGSL